MICQLLKQPCVKIHTLQPSVVIGLRPEIPSELQVVRYPGSSVNCCQLSSTRLFQGPGKTRFPSGQETVSLAMWMPPCMTHSNREILPEKINKLFQIMSRIPATCSGIEEECCARNPSGVDLRMVYDHTELDMLLPTSFDTFGSLWILLVYKSRKPYPKRLN